MIYKPKPRRIKMENSFLFIAGCAILMYVVIFAMAFNEYRIVKNEGSGIFVIQKRQLFRYKNTDMQYFTWWDARQKLQSFADEKARLKANKTYKVVSSGENKKESYGLETKFKVSKKVKVNG